MSEFEKKSGKSGRQAIERRTSRITSLCIIGCVATTLAGYSMERSETTVRNEVNQWMTGNPVMVGKSIQNLQIYPNATTPGAVSVVTLAPRGTVVVNRDDRLPAIVLFTPDETVQNLNTFSDVVQHGANRLAIISGGGTVTKQPTGIQSDVYVSAMLNTRWGQWAPFNLYMPTNPAHNNERAVTGCGTIGMAQILNHFQWPPYGEGTVTHQDNEGAFRPILETQLGTNYRWDLMKPTYTGTETGPEAAAVAQLAYDIATIGGIDCEYNVSGINLDNTGTKLGYHMFYEKENVVVGNTASRLSIEQNLLRGIPVPGDIMINQNGNGHAVVFDGLLVHKGQTSYHIDYGWNGVFNFWWDKDALLDVWQVKPGIRPALIPLPETKSVLVTQGQTPTVAWKIATQRQTEIKQLNLYQKVLRNGTWADDCESLPPGTDTRSWSLAEEEGDGNCWKANSPYPSDYLTIADELIPNATTNIVFETRYQCFDNYAQIEVSVNGGEFTSIHRFGKSIQPSWNTRYIPLGEFAGKTLKLRIGYYAPPMSAYYSDEQGGGVWIDNLRVYNTLMNKWELVDTVNASEMRSTGQTVTTTHPEFQNLEIGAYTFSASLTDTNNLEHRAGNQITIEVKENTRETTGIPTFSGTPGAYRIGLNATEAGRYFLERSEDLQTWNYHSEIQVSEPGPIEFQDNENGHSRMFYRIGKETDTGN